MPGEHSYRVIGKDGKVLGTEMTQLSAPLAPATAGSSPWWDGPVQSLTQADQPTQVKKPAQPSPPARPADRACRGRPRRPVTPETMTEQDLAVVSEQLGGRRATPLGVAHRCPCGSPDVVATAPRLADGTPFPTFYYLTCPTASSAIGTLEASGVMTEMTERLGSDPDLRRLLPARARRAIWPTGSATARSPRSPGSRPVGCRRGSSACMCWWRTRWPPDPG